MAVLGAGGKDVDGGDERSHDTWGGDERGHDTRRRDQRGLEFDVGADQPASVVVSTRTPGPIVELSATFCT